MSKTGPIAGVLLLTTLVVTGVVVLLPSRSPPVGNLAPLPSLSPDGLFVDADVRSQVTQAQRAVESRPHDAQANGRLGMLYEIYQLPEAALVCFERAALLAPREFRWQFLLGRSQRQLGDSEAAIETLRRALEICAQDAPALVLLGDACVELSRLDEAQQAYRTAREVAPGACLPLLGLGRVAAHRNDHRRAVEYFVRALEIAPQHAPIHYALALSCRALGEVDQAQQHFDAAAAGSRFNPDPNPLVGEMFELERGIPADLRNAMAAMSARRYAQSVAILRSIVSRDPENSDAHALIGQCYVQMGRDAQALEALDAAFRLNPSSLTILRRRGRLLLRAGRPDDAIECLERVIQLGGNLAQDHSLLGQAYLKTDQTAKARRTFEQALAIDSDHAEARYWLEQLQTQAGPDH